MKKIEQDDTTLFDKIIEETPKEDKARWIKEDWADIKGHGYIEPGMTIITLSNGKRVANFSSPHEFRFTDGSVLPACPDEMAERLKVTFKEKDLGNGDIELSFDLSLDVLRHMRQWSMLHKDGQVDVVFCCLPMITALKEMDSIAELVKTPFRAIRQEDRINKLLSIDKQCI